MDCLCQPLYVASGDTGDRYATVLGSINRMLSHVSTIGSFTSLSIPLWPVGPSVLVSDQYTQTFQSIKSISAQYFRKIAKHSSPVR